ncbi:oligosaccharide flippase family protein, partial [Parabacteroides sp.]
MSESIKNKAIRGVAWSAVEKFLRQGLMTLFSIIIARQLSPSDYGLVAMLTIFLIVAQVFVDSGFMEALIQKQDRTEVDFSTTFWFNIGVALLIYVMLFLVSPFIADFYGEPLLKDLLIWMALIFVINAFRTVQQAKLNI